MSASKSILTDRLPTEICGLPFNSDFRSIIRFFEIQGNNDMSEDEKAREIISTLFPSGVPDTEELGKELREFISMGEESDGSSEKVFDFRIDASRIFASFFQAYHIDLTKENLHWWSFISLFSALPDDTIIRKVIDIRTKKIDPKMSEKERTALIRSKDRYSLNTATGGDDYGLGVLFGRK